jgi:hypothetical protein
MKDKIDLPPKLIRKNLEAFEGEFESPELFAKHEVKYMRKLLSKNQVSILKMVSVL